MKFEFEKKKAVMSYIISSSHKGNFLEDSIALAQTLGETGVREYRPSEWLVLHCHCLQTDWHGDIKFSVPVVR